MKWNNRQPLWMPQGSVRAILALLAVGSTVWLVVTAAITPSEWLPIVAAIVAFYFGQKNTTAS